MKTLSGALQRPERQWAHLAIWGVGERVGGKEGGWPTSEMIIIQGLVGWRKEGAAFYRIQSRILSSYSPKASRLFSQLAGELGELGKRARFWQPWPRFKACSSWSRPHRGSRSVCPQLFARSPGQASSLRGLSPSKINKSFVLLLRRLCNYSKHALAARSHAEAIVEVSQMHLALGLGEQHEEPRLQLAHAGPKTSDFRSREWHAGWAWTAGHSSAIFLIMGCILSPSYPMDS